MTQGEAVFQAVLQVVGEPRGKVLDYITPEETKQVEAVVFSMFKSGECSHSKNPDDTTLMKYIPGLVNNWLRKDLRLNGGTEYQPKRPGSRTNSGDKQLANMKNLLKLVGPNKELETAIKLREAEVAEMRKPVVDINHIPEELRHLVPQK